MRQQRTIKKEIGCTGIGMHSGKRVKMVVRPLPPSTGIAFMRTDLPGQPTIKASWQNVVDTRLATTLGYQGGQVATVEHFLAAAFGLGVDNLLLEIDGPELPIMDGSAADFVKLLQQSGIVEQGVPLKYLRLLRSVKVSEGDREAALLPGPGFSLSLVIDYDHPLIGTQSFAWALTRRSFEEEISRSRTFGFLKEVQALKANGLAQGGSLSNAVVVGENHVLNRDGLRYQDEFVRHKALDCLGDLALMGFPLLAHYQAYKPGHALNHKLVTKVLASPENYLVIQDGAQEESTSSLAALAS